MSPKQGQDHGCYLYVSVTCTGKYMTNLNDTKEFGFLKDAHFFLDITAETLHTMEDYPYLEINNIFIVIFMKEMIFM